MHRGVDICQYLSELSSSWPRRRTCKVQQVFLFARHVAFWRSLWGFCVHWRRQTQRCALLWEWEVCGGLQLPRSFLAFDLSSFFKAAGFPPETRCPGVQHGLEEQRRTSALPLGSVVSPSASASPQGFRKLRCFFAERRRPAAGLRLTGQERGPRCSSSACGGMLGVFVGSRVWSCTVLKVFLDHMC